MRERVFKRNSGKTGRRWVTTALILALLAGQPNLSVYAEELPTVDMPAENVTAEEADAVDTNEPEEGEKTPEGGKGSAEDGADISIEDSEDDNIPEEDEDGSNDNTDGEGTDENDEEILDAITADADIMQLEMEAAALVADEELTVREVGVGGSFEEGGLIYTVLENDNVAVAHSWPMPEGELIIPSSVEHDGKPYTVTEISETGFSGCEQLTKVEIPESITKIGRGAFQVCKKLTHVKIPNQPIAFDYAVFGQCGFTSIDDIVGRSAMTEIPQSMFAGCDGLSRVTIPDHIKTIGAGAFANCYMLKEANISSGVTEIKTQAFTGCPNLTTVTMEYGVTTLEGLYFPTALI